MATSNGKRYEWDVWLRKGLKSRKPVLLRRGVHYQCAQTTMVQNTRNAAAVRGYRVSVYDREDHLEVTVKSGPPKAAEKGGE